MKTKKMKVPQNFQWAPDPYEQQKVEVLMEHTGITSGTQLIQAAFSRWYNEIKDAHYNAKYGKQFGSADHQ